jgi:enoyl-CoA hydratase
MSTEPRRDVVNCDAAAGQVHVSMDGRVGWIVLDNAPKLNAISHNMWQALIAGLSAFEEAPVVRCVAIAGRGEKAFCAGADVSEKDRLEHESSEGADHLARASLSRIQAFPKPTIAMISGHCVGAGLAIAAACDIRIAAVGSCFAVPSARLGLPYYRAQIRRLADLVGPSIAKRMVFTADRISGDQALRFGLVDELVPVDELPATVRDMAARIAANAPLTIAAAKHALEMAYSEVAGADIASCTECEQACVESQDYIEGRRAFLEKRVPLFQGR